MKSIKHNRKPRKRKLAYNRGGINVVTAALSIARVIGRLKKLNQKTYSLGGFVGDGLQPEIVLPIKNNTGDKLKTGEVVNINVDSVIEKKDDSIPYGCLISPTLKWVCEHEDNNDGH